MATSILKVELYLATQTIGRCYNLHQYFCRTAAVCSLCVGLIRVIKALRLADLQQQPDHGTMPLPYYTMTETVFLANMSATTHAFRLLSEIYID